ncbi:methyl-accepting chemotaxis protein [Leptospira sp. 96542]|nr:methyl-accepting chemotaxis protein [Leptospira sp. 96542]
MNSIQTKNSSRIQINKIYLIDKIILFCLIICTSVIVISWYWEQEFKSYRTEIVFVLILVLILSIVLKIFKFKIFKTITEPEVFRADPVLLLAAVGLDLKEFSNLINANLLELDGLIVDVGTHLNELNGKISQMSEDIGNVYTIVSQLAQQEVTLMDAVSKTSSEINIMFDIVNSVIDEIQLRNKTMEELALRSSNGREKVRNTEETIQRIAESSDGVLKLIDFINGISKETNLLAINASIEASHSGTEGKGFTVIADEIRKLATLTAQNAKEVTKQLRNNISDYTLAFEASSESGKAFEYIASEIHIVHQTIAEVIQSIAELKTRGSTILEKANSLDEIAAKVRDTSGEVYGEIISINSYLEETKQLSDNIYGECIQMKESKELLNNLTKKMQDRVQEINEETDGFLKNENLLQS